MSTIVKSKEYRWSVDSFGNPARVGNVIIHTCYNSLAEAVILGFTENGIYVSHRVNHYRSAIDLHNSKKYYRYFDFKVIDATQEVPEHLKPFCNFQQMHEMNGPIQ